MSGKLTPNFTIYRDINGDEHELDIYVDLTYERSRFFGDHTQPPDPDTFDVNDWTIVADNGQPVSPEESQRIKDLVGEDLTAREEEDLFIKQTENEDDLDPPDFRDDF